MRDRVRVTFRVTVNLNRHPECLQEKGDPHEWTSPDGSKFEGSGWSSKPNPGWIWLTQFNPELNPHKFDEDGWQYADTWDAKESSDLANIVQDSKVWHATRGKRLLRRTCFIRIQYLFKGQEENISSQDAAAYATKRISMYGGGSSPDLDDAGFNGSSPAPIEEDDETLQRSKTTPVFRSIISSLKSPDTTSNPDLIRGARSVLCVPQKGCINTEPRAQKSSKGVKVKEAIGPVLHRLHRSVTLRWGPALIRPLRRTQP